MMKKAIENAKRVLVRLAATALAVAALFCLSACDPKKPLSDNETMELFGQLVELIRDEASYSNDFLFTTGKCAISCAAGEARFFGDESQKAAVNELLNDLKGFFLTANLREYAREDEINGINYVSIAKNVNLEMIGEGVLLHNGDVVKRLTGSFYYDQRKGMTDLQITFEHDGNETCADLYFGVKEDIRNSMLESIEK